MNHASIHKIAATVVKDCQARWVWPQNWRYAATHRLRAMTGESIETCQVIVSEMSDI